MLKAILLESLMIKHSTLKQRPNGVRSYRFTCRAEEYLELYDYILTQTEIEHIESILWCINSPGSLTLRWKESGEDICILSGNGKWDLTPSSWIYPPENKDKIILDAEGFLDLDSFTLIITCKE